MIHNHEVPGSIPGLATETEKVEKLSPFFVLYYCKQLVCGKVDILIDFHGSPAKVGGLI